MGRRAGAPGGGPASPPGVSRGIFSCLETERGRRDTVTESFAPMGLDLRTTWVPGLTPGARLWSPLRGSVRVCHLGTKRKFVDVDSLPIGLSVSEMSKLQTPNSKNSGCVPRITP